MSHRTIRQIFESRLTAWAKARSPALRVAYEGVAFTPTNNETYLRAYTLPAGTNTNTLAGDHHAYTGVFQVSIVTPSGSGSGAAEGIADEIDDLFPVYLRLTKADFEVMVLTPVEPSPGIIEGANYIVAVSFQYRADTE
jgi:hypothetical protein